METSEIVLEYFKLFLSWPASAVAITIIVIWNFKDSISTWLINLKIEYKDATLSSQKHLNTLDRDSDEFKKDVIIQKEAKSDHINLPESTEGKNDLIVQWRASAYLWEYRYLNYYLVKHTHEVLDWFYGLKEPIAYFVFDTAFRIQIPAPSERSAVISALEQHYLIEKSNEHFSITPKGKEYIENMGNAEKRNTLALG